MAIAAASASQSCPRVAAQGSAIARSSSRRAVERADRGQRCELLLLELVVEGAGVLADDHFDRLLDVGELAAQDIDALELVPAGRPSQRSSAP
jgi:hypothetical protein